MPDGRRSGRWAEWQRADGDRRRANQLREHRNLDRAPTAVTHTVENTDLLLRAWIARFGRTAADHALDVVERRMRALQRNHPT